MNATRCHSSASRLARTKNSAWVLALASLVVGSPVTAQESSDEVVEEILVTGTNIRGGELIGSEAIDIDEKTLTDGGEATLADFLREIPINFAGGVGMSDETLSGQDVGPEGANLGAGQGVNLRALGALSTLVLINGRRVPASGQFGDFVDVSNIPASAVERIEILPDGSSAIYGSDAIGGVVNFILKDSIDGPITSLRVGTATQGGGDEILFSQLFGGNGDRSNWVLGAEYYSREAVKATDRSPYDNGSDFSSQGGVNWQAYSAHFGPAANIFLSDQGGAVNSPVGAMVPQGANTNLVNADLLYGQSSSSNVFDAMDLLPETERISAFGSMDFDIADGVYLHGDFTYTSREADYENGYGVLYDGTAAVVPTISPFYIADIDPSLQNTADGGIPFSLVIDDRPVTRHVDVDAIDIALGVAFDIFADWQLDTTASYGSVEQQRVRWQPANVPVGGQMNAVTCALQGPATANPACAALGLTPFNPWSTDPISDAQLDELFGFEDLTFDSSVWQFTAIADGSLFDLPGGAAKLAVGVDYREEKMDGFLNWNTGSLDVLSGPYTETKRDATAAFLEFSLPLADSISVSVAGRYEEFSGTGDYDSFDPRIGVDWNITDSFRLRGSWGTSFHAPPMRYENDDPQPLPGGNAAFVLPASYQGPCDSTLVDFNGIIGTPGTPGEFCSFSVIINSGGAGEGVLKPEEAETWSFGFDYEPEAIEGLRASLNYFNIEIDDRIQRIQSGTLPGIVAEVFATGTSPFITALNIRPDDADAQALLDSEKFLGTFGPPFFNTAADIQMIVNATQLNIAKLETSGFDFYLGYDFVWGDTELNVFTNGTWLDTYDTEAAPGAGVIDQLGKYSSFGAPVELRSKQGVSFTSGAFDGAFIVNYTSDYECAIGSCMVPGAGGFPTANTSPVDIDSWVTVDFNIGWNLSNFGSWAEGATVRLTATNLFDEDPPFIDAGSGVSDPLPSAYDPNNATTIGRIVALTFSKSWN